MATTDSNGLVQYTEPDELTPLEGAFNVLSSSVSSAFNSTVRTFKVANAAARNALATQRTPTASNPLQVWRNDLKWFEINDGTGWVAWHPDPNIVVVGGSKYRRSGYINLTNPWVNQTIVELTTNVYRVNFNLDVSSLVPPNYGINLWVSGCSGWGVVSNNHAAGNPTTTVRGFQNSHARIIEQLSWEIFLKT